MKVYGWGRYPQAEASLAFAQSPEHCSQLVQDGHDMIARGLGRSYGDSSLAIQMVSTRYLDHLLAFEEATGVLRCSAGTTLDEILRVFVPRGWFLPVTPGTRFVTIGGAIASDVHGKNHHLDGCFSEHVTRIELLLGNGERVFTSATELPDLFHATCGGMGLTGVILAATLRLRPIRSSVIVETTLKTPNLEAVVAAFEDNSAATYSVAWIDCLARGANLGRSLLMLGEHDEDGPLATQSKAAMPIPFNMPSGMLNRATATAFNSLYYGRVRQPRQTRRIPFEPFFYPLDALSDWNRLYGKRGFVQYQFVLPKQGGTEGLREVLERIAASGQGAFLAVLKAFGKGNGHPLSFPREGYTLALDFKANTAAFRLLDDLDQVVLGHGGRLYLAKDARMSEATFKTSYPRWQEFEGVRQRYHALGKFSSAQSRRLGLQ